MTARSTPTLADLGAEGRSATRRPVLPTRRGRRTQAAIDAADGAAKSGTQTPQPPPPAQEGEQQEKADDGPTEMDVD